jgi:biopolymer transport protein ExbB
MLDTLLFHSGPIMPVLLVTALTGYVLAWERAMVWSRWQLRDRHVATAKDAATLRGGLAREAQRPGATPLAAVLRRAAALGPMAATERESRVQEALLGQVARVDARIATIGWLGTILPMLGLLGTVSGMIGTFQDLAQTTSRQVLSQGLSEALWTTEVGLLGAMPLMAVHHVLTRLRERWFNRLERLLTLLALDDDPPATEGAPRKPALAAASAAGTGGRRHEA